MGQPLRLEVFEVPDLPEGPSLLMPDELEELRLAAYERGYVAGWSDSGQQAEAEAANRRAAIEQRVEALNFTYHEARGHVLKALRPLLEAVVDCVLPAIARSTLVPLVLEQLLPLAHEAAEAPVTLRIGAGSRADFAQALEGLVLPPVALVETADLAEGQADFTLGEAETRIDLGHVAGTIRKAIDDFYQIQSEESQHA